MRSEAKKYSRKGEQGDLRFQMVDESAIPSDAVQALTAKSDDGTTVYIVGHSESGHHHIVDATQAILYETSDPFIAYLRLADGEDAVMKHQKTGEHVHGDATLSNPGPCKAWKVSRQREYFPEGVRQAAD